MGCFNSCCKPHSNALLFLGLCDSGKTTIASYIEHSAFRVSHPTLGVQITNAVYQDQRVEIWDVSGRDVAYWSRYYSIASGIIFVIDGLNLNDLDLILQYMTQSLARPDVRHLPILIYCNKIWDSDPNNVKHIIEAKLELNNRGLNYQIQPCDPKIGKGVLEGFYWLMGQIPHP
ncbi:ADP-ribosylation factor, putative [Trichomonas vaginalis G3]|uniref:ADP-ribosylation factor, putative n=1 Tax=Trichomonas vaginalis (strain ATCC PRA-98 / G3) TaxID=412133 RepID=A2FK56_TRIV3|nr:small GTPase superfamily, Arf family [Trichomonas vaginalis G3]EAX94696.1 ADP-ribosylation factor, putative [Trichomonas vaginalis G3]KAI5504126.1 small GTPase superfamily, Arf family [Trichomonas vaginalis G3]|eukprot:XP_001307626.1 ADP-ribosylation factor [Trichomonas vaginalis G3]